MMPSVPKAPGSASRYPGGSWRPSGQPDRHEHVRRGKPVRDPLPVGWRRSLDRSVRRGILAVHSARHGTRGALLGRACRHDPDAGGTCHTGFDTCNRQNGSSPARFAIGCRLYGCHRRSPSCGAVSRASCSRAGVSRPAIAQNLSHQSRGARKPSGEPARRL